MTRYAQLVIGPAGSGKSTYCSHLQQHCASVGRSTHVINLDPAADQFTYEVAADIRELISLEDVMEELKLGPNGGLIYCMEYLEDNIDDWLAERLDEYIDDDYVVFDCPVYLLDSQFVSDVTKFISGSLASLSAMIQLELPHVNVMTKMDLLANKKEVERFLEPDTRLLLADLNSQMAPRFRRLNEALAGLVDDYSMVNFLPLDIRDEHSIEYVLYHIDNAIQFGEDADVKIRDQDLENDETINPFNFADGQSRDYDDD